MSAYAIVKTEEALTNAVRSVLQKILSTRSVDAILVAARTPYSTIPMPTLFVEPEKMVRVDPLAPVSPFNTARQAATLTRHPSGKKIALVMRPCEIRAFIELVKLNQGTLTDVIIIGVECLGRMENDVFLKNLGDNQEITAAFYQEAGLRAEITSACKACDHFQPKGADLTVCVIGCAVNDQIGLLAETQTGEELLARLDLSKGDVPPEREATAASLYKERLDARDRYLKETSRIINKMEGFQKLIGNCLSCFNCRTACPVCYCKECVFLTDVFAHDADLLLRRASKKGLLKMPTDTCMFHLTRLVHMAHACVGCGQCSSVCPSGIPVADIFITVADQIQTLFNYEPGRDVSEPIPHTVFQEDAAFTKKSHNE